MVFQLNQEMRDGRRSAGRLQTPGAFSSSFGRRAMICWPSMKPASLITLALFAASIASASVIFATGDNPQVDSAVLFNCPTVCTSGSGLTVTGHLQQVIPDTAVNFTSLDDILVTVAPGNNTISGLSSTVGFDDIAITIPGHTFTSIIVQLTSLASATDGTVTFTAFTFGGGSAVSPALFDSHTGGNFFTITTTGGTQITELDLSTTQFQDNVSQVRIGGVSGVSMIPEPATYCMVGVALAGLASLRRQRSR
jgi:PEP-CTERM motif-containing protein